MKIKAFASRYDMTQGESPNLLIGPQLVEAWWGRDPFDAVQAEGISKNLIMAPEGTADGHNLMRDSTFTDSLRIDKQVPISPLFVKDLAGRVIYIGFGPERKANVEWEEHALPLDAEGKVVEGEENPFVPLCVFPRFCRDAEAMEGRELLEHVFLTKFRCLEMSLGYNGQLSGAGEDEELVSAAYMGANLYPYKLRLDTFYGDGWKLPQTQMVFARGHSMGINPTSARRIGEQLLAHWQGRAGGGYADWLEALGEAEVERLYVSGCTLIPTFEACNGYHVVGPNFELEDYWPGRAVMGLHDVVEERGDKAPAGTILDVIEPGFVTASYVRPAKVIISDGSGYVSPNATDPEPLVPNLNLPHQRTLDDWRATWVPTHPEHFEAPALWGWDLNMGRFMQLGGPIWDPLHYFYESVDVVLAAFEATPVTSERPLVLVPEDMGHRFYPVVPMRGFDTFSYPEYQRRRDKGVLPQSCLKRVPTEDYTAGIGYHPMPAEFEFELDTFWFPEMHPLNRDQGAMVPDVADRIAPVINPQVVVSAFVVTVDVPELVEWMRNKAFMYTPKDDPIENYPQLCRYLIPDMAMEDIVRICPVPFLSDPGPKLAYPAAGWWLDEDGNQLDGPLVLQEVVPNVQDALWDMRQEGIQLVQFRHMVYRSQLPLYMLGWWYGWGVRQLEGALEEWVDTGVAEEAAFAEAEGALMEGEFVEGQ